MKFTQCLFSISSTIKSRLPLAIWRWPLWLYLLRLRIWFRLLLWLLLLLDIHNKCSWLARFSVFDRLLLFFTSIVIRCLFFSVSWALNLNFHKFVRLLRWIKSDIDTFKSFLDFLVMFFSQFCCTGWWNKRSLLLDVWDRRRFGR